MSEQINEQVETSMPEVEVEIPETEAKVEVQPQPVQQVVVMPTTATVKQRMLDTGLTMVCGVVVTSAMNVVSNAVGKGLQAGGKKLKELAEAKKEKRLQRKAAKEAAKLEAAKKAQEVSEEATPEEVTE